MSITDPVITVFNKNHGWMLLQGNETFYDENRNLRTWSTEAEAKQWARDNLQNLSAGS